MVANEREIGLIGCSNRSQVTNTPCRAGFTQAIADYNRARNTAYYYQELEHDESMVIHTMPVNSGAAEKLKRP